MEIGKAKQIKILMNRKDYFDDLLKKTENGYKDEYEISYNGVVVHELKENELKMLREYASGEINKILCEVVKIK